MAVASKRRDQLMLWVALAQGSRWGSQEVDEQDEMVKLVNATILTLFEQEPSKRPPATTVNRKFARFIRELLEADEKDE